jgi:2'-5' RNA ligase
MQKRVIVAFPRIENPAGWEEVLSARERFDPLARLVEPHLTLVSPFEDPMSDAALEQHVRTAVCELRSFAVTLRDVTVHENEYLFLNVKRGNDRVVDLRDALYAGPLAAHLSRTHTFVPHVTVGRVRTQDLPAAIEATAGLTTSIDAMVSSVSVYRIDADGGRPTLFEVPLLSPCR